MTKKKKTATMKMMKRLLVLLFLVLSGLSLFVGPVTAETQTIQLEKRYDLPSAADLEESKKNCRDGICADNMMNFQLSALAGAATCTTGGLICGAKNEAEAQSYIQRSVLGQTSQAMAFLYSQPPATTTEYLAWVGERAGFIPKTYAQGITYSRLLPILPIWKAFRDIAFILLAIVMLMIGLMIMFRAKVNPQTVANVENTIPRVVVSIILIWLSFPIATLIIDFMYVLIAAGIGVIGNAVGDLNLNQAIQEYTTGGFGTLFSKTMSPVSEFASIGGVGSGFAIAGGIGLLGFLPLLAATPIGWIGAIVMAISGIASGAIAGDAGVGLLTLASPILILLILIVLLFSVFKIFFMLLSAYIQILISIILGPLYLLVNAVPGRNTFTTWWKGIVANMMSFVVTANMLYLAWAIASKIQSQSFWTPPFIMQGVGVPQAAIGLISLGIVLLIPQAVAMVKQALGVKSIFQVGPGMIFAPITGSVGQGLGLAGQFHTASQAFPMIKNFFTKGPGASKS